MKNKLKDTALLLKDIVTQPEVVKELEFAIRYNTDNLNKDERVTFKELLDENAAYKKVLKKQKTKVAEINSFANAFRHKAKGLHKNKILFKSGEELAEFLKREDIVIYWPYSEYWHKDIDEIKGPTLTYDPIDNEHTNEGFEPVILSSNSQQKGSSETWKTVTVDDTYAQENPTLIIKPNYVDPCIPYCGGEGDPGDGGDGNTNSDNTYDIHVKEDVSETAQVHLGYIQLNEQLDGLYRGGTDLRFVFVDVVEIEPGKIEAKPIYREKKLTRPDVSNHRWKELNYLIDHRWHSYQKTLPYHAYDHDGEFRG